MTMTTEGTSRSAPLSAAQGAGWGVQVTSLLLPILKCAVCPACLSIFGGLFAGARMGFLGDERLHGGLIVAALVFDLFILRAAMKHHDNGWPLLLCVVGGSAALVGHAFSLVAEYIGFALLMAAAVVNIVLLRKHRHEGGSCCAHDSHHAHATHHNHAHAPHL